MAFPDNIYLRVLMFVCSYGTTLSKRDSPLHDTQHTHTVRVLDKYKNSAYWRSDSINIYHNHKIKILFKPIDCNLIGCCFSSGRVPLYISFSPMCGLTIVKWSQWNWLYFFFIYHESLSKMMCVGVRSLAQTEYLRLCDISRDQRGSDIKQKYNNKIPWHTQSK